MGLTSLTPKDGMLGQTLERRPRPAFGHRQNALHRGQFGVTRKTEGLHSTRCSSAYNRALELARLEDYKAAREAFLECVSRFPDFVKAWVSWAQMEKRAMLQAEDHLMRCREVLQLGLTLNPNNASLCQAMSWLDRGLQQGQSSLRFGPGYV